ncbi:MAG: DUF4358 domain-containing protein [Lachnospiraceae bacterium]|nr:DUF4358 domain-containing protein [Lachnospiraceae bacterium]
MRKIKFLCLAAMVMLAMTACGGKTDEEPDNNSPTLTMTPEPTVTVEPTNTPTAEPTAEPTKRPADNKTVEEHKKIAEKIYQAVKGSGTYNAELMVQDDETYMSDVLGLDSSWYDVAIVEIPMFSTNVDMFALIHPTEGNFENVETAIKNYQDFVINDSFQYPMNVEKVKKCKAEAIGDYMFFILLNSPDKAIQAIEEVLAKESE